MVLGVLRGNVFRGIEEERQFKSLTIIIKLMGKKGKYRQQEEEEIPKKKTMITQEQLMDKSHMDKTQFIPLLPSDSLYPPFIFDQHQEAALDKIVTDLNYLLYVSFKQFWTTLLYNPTLKHSLSSALSFLHRRWLNNYLSSKLPRDKFDQDDNNLQHFRIVKDGAIYECSEGVDQAVLLIFHRMVSFNNENKELSLFYKIGEEITAKYLLDIPRLLELCQIYGQNNDEIVRYIVKMYANTRSHDFYQQLTDEILPILIKKVNETVRGLKNQTDREQYGINFNYKRVYGEKLSQGEEQLRKKNMYLMELISFLNILENIIQFFPDNCLDHCYYNSQIHLLVQNIFLELEVAYKVWNYQTQEAKMLALINTITRKCVNYFIKYFQRCNNILVLRNMKVSTTQAYVNSLDRIFSDFGKRATVVKKNQSHNMLMYKIIQKEFDVHSMIHRISQKQIQELEIYQESQYGFNMEFVKEIIIAFDNQFKEEYINEDEPRQEEIEEETQAEPVNQDDIDDVEGDKENLDRKKDELKEKGQTKEEKQELEMMEILVPKRMRSEDYYQKLYEDYNKKFYKGEYEDDYDEIADHDKRPIFYEEDSSSQSEEEKEKHLVSNQQYLAHINQIHHQHQKFTVNREEIRNKNVNKPKFGKVETNPSGNKKYVEKGKNQDEGVKKKYMEKPVEKASESIKQEAGEYPQEKGEEWRQKQQAPESRGGQGYKKSNKSYNYKPKNKNQNNDKGRNSNKNRDERRNR